jgi:SET domain-containing protein
VPQADRRQPAATVATSAIAGRGLFAAAPMNADQVVVTLVGVVETVDGLGRVNHSCEPNLWLDAERNLVTIREIAQGDEFTVDYSTLLGDPDFVLRCHCASTRCRQMVTGDDWRIPQLQQRYAGRWAPELQHRIEAASR